MCTFREIYEANIQLAGQFNRFLECILFFVYLAVVVEALRYHFAWCGLNFTDFHSIAEYMDIYKLSVIPEVIKHMEAAHPEINFISFDKIHVWSGRMIEWCFFEYMVFMFYVLTLIVTIIKSRFMNVGTDSSY